MLHYMEWNARQVKKFGYPAIIGADFQNSHKEAAIEHLTNCMMEAGQGALVKAMKNLFAACIEQARESHQGTG